jgi:hypothetical protein
MPTDEELRRLVEREQIARNMQRVLPGAVPEIVDALLELIDAQREVLQRWLDETPPPASHASEWGACVDCDTRALLAAARVVVGEGE